MLRERRPVVATTRRIHDGDQAAAHRAVADGRRAGARIRAHYQDAGARIRRLAQADLDRELPFFGRQVPVREILWDMIISHHVPHRGQLALMCRLAGGQTPGLYGPNREEMADSRCGSLTENQGLRN